MNITRIIAIILALLASVTNAAPASRSLDMWRFEVQKFFTDELSSHLSKIMSNSPYYLRVTVQLDDKALTRDVGLISSPQSNLPGLADRDESVWQSRDGMMSVRRLVSYVKETSVVVVTDELNSNASTALKEAIISHLATLSKTTVQVKVTRNANLTNLLRSSKKEAAAVMPAPVVNVAPTFDPSWSKKFEKFLDKTMQDLIPSAATRETWIKNASIALGIILLLSVFALALLFTLNRSLNRSLLNLGAQILDAAKNHASVTASQGMSAPAPTTSATANSVASSTAQASGGDKTDFDTVMERLKAQVSADLHLATELSIFLYRDRNYAALAILYACITDEDRKVFDQVAPVEQRAEFQTFWRDEGYLILKSVTKACDLAMEVSRLMWLGKRDRAALFYHFQKSAMARMSDESLTSVLNNRDPQIVQAAVQATDPQRVAYLLAQDLVRMETIVKLPKGEPAEAALEKLNQLIFSLSQSQTTAKASGMDAVIAKIADFLPQTYESQLRDMSGMASDHSNEIVRNDIEFVVGWLNRLDPTRCSHLLASFDEVLRQNILSNLPDLKARRISSQGFSFVAESLSLKADLMRELRMRKKTKINAGITNGNIPPNPAAIPPPPRTIPGLPELPDAARVGKEKKNDSAA